MEKETITCAYCKKEIISIKIGLHSGLHCIDCYEIVLNKEKEEREKVIRKQQRKNGEEFLNALDLVPKEETEFIPTGIDSNFKVCGFTRDRHREKLIRKLDSFKVDCLAKYDAGRDEHGGDINKLDLDKEMYKEFMDMFNYYAFKS